MTPSETNRRVAEICGLPVHAHYDELRYEYADRLKLDPSLPPDNGRHRFDPYHDANDALWAAERVGLWNDRLLFPPQHPGRLWAICQFDAGDCTALGSEPALSAAICAAILALKEVVAHA